MKSASQRRAQYERWHIRTCARCGRQAAKAANWPDGPICRTCLDGERQKPWEATGPQVSNALELMSRIGRQLPVCLRRQLLWSASGPLKRQTRSAQQSVSQPPTVSDALLKRGSRLKAAYAIGRASPSAFR